MFPALDYELINYSERNLPIILFAQQGVMIVVSVEFLATIPLFSSLSTPELTEMSKSWVVVDKNKNVVIFRKGDPSDAIYIIQKGMVTISILAFNGENMVLSVLKNKDIFGELTLFEITERSATAIVAKKTRLLKMSRESFINFIKQYPDIAIKMLALLSKRLRDTNTIIERQITRNVNDEIESEITVGERIADSFAGAIGSWTFIIIFICLLLSWITLNIYMLLDHLDPYPFILLNLILSCTAALQAPVIMMSQGRQAKKDHIAADLDYKINLKAELQIEEILVQLNKINSEENIQNEIHKVKNELMEKLDYIAKQHDQTGKSQ